MKHRFYNWLYALLHAYYWAPCSICGQMYGGHEGGKCAGLWMTGGGAKTVCQDCDDSAELHRLNIWRIEAGLVCDAPIRELDPTDADPRNYARMIYTRRPGEPLCPSCQSLLDHARRRLAELTA